MGAEIFLLARGKGAAGLATGLGLAVLCLITFWLTRSNSEALRQPCVGRLIWLQLLACAFVIVATTLEGAIFNGVVPARFGIPGWKSLHDAIFAFSAGYLPGEIANGIANVSLYCIPIATVLLCLGVPLAQQGFDRFRRGSVLTAIIWLLLPSFALVWTFVAGHVPLTRVTRILLQNLLQNGFSEEYLWRGAIMGRLSALMRSEHALYVQAILFGVWHVGADLRAFSNIAEAIAQMIAVQMTFGLAVGYLTQRTGNIAVGSVVHLLADSVS